MSSKRPIFKDDDFTFEYPLWEDCQWRRISCNKVDCPLCGRILKHDAKMRLRGKDPDSIESALECVSDSFSETRMMLEQDGFDFDSVEEPENWKEREALHNHPLNVRVRCWMKNVHDFIKMSHMELADWINTESGKDICWYHTILPVKTDRQITNRWEMDNENDDGCDYQYTRWVLEEVLNTLEKAISELLSSNSISYEEKSSFYQLLDELKSLEKDILSI